MRSARARLRPRCADQYTRPQTAPDRTTRAMPATHLPPRLPEPTPGLDPPSDDMRAAFRELHWSVACTASRCCSRSATGRAPRGSRRIALAAGAERVDELRHPERAAAWLRRRVVRSKLGASPPTARRIERRRALLELGVRRGGWSPRSTALEPRSRGPRWSPPTVERLDRRDVGRSSGARDRPLEPALLRTRREYGSAGIRRDPRRSRRAMARSRRHGGTNLARRAMG